MASDQRVTIPRDLYERMAKVWALWEMGLLVTAPADSPIKMPPRDSSLPAARHTPEPVEEPVVGHAEGAPDKLDAGTAMIPGLGPSAEWRPTNAAAPRNKDGAPAGA